MFDDLKNYSDEELNRARKMIDIAKIMQEINHNHEINMATIAKMQAETEKLRKEAKFYPLVVAGGLGGLVVAIINHLLK